MKIPYLAVLTGFPSTGKSEIANYLVSEHQFVRVSSDDLRESFYHESYHELKKTPEKMLKEQVMLMVMQYAKMSHLYHGLDVVVDSTAYCEEARKQWFNTAINPEQYILTDNHLLYVSVERKLIEDRNKMRGRELSDLKLWDEKWEEPKENINYKLLKLENNTPEDLKRIYEVLDKQFSRNRFSS